MMQAGTHGAILSGVMTLAGVILLIISVMGGWPVAAASVVSLSLGALLLAACLASGKGRGW